PEFLTETFSSLWSHRKYFDESQPLGKGAPDSLLNAAAASGRHHRNVEAVARDIPELHKAFGAATGKLKRAKKSGKGVAAAQREFNTVAKQYDDVFVQRFGHTRTQVDASTLESLNLQRTIAFR